MKNWKNNEIPLLSMIHRSNPDVSPSFPSEFGLSVLQRESKPQGQSIFLFKQRFPYRGLKPSLLSTLAGEIRCLQAFKRSPIMTESLMERWLSGSVKWTFPFSAPALQLLAVDSIHFRKWIACAAFPKSWVSSFVVGSHSYFLIEAFFLPLSVLPPA